METAYYRSPVGTIFIKSNDEVIEEVLFTNTMKEVKVNEDEIEFKTNYSSPIKDCIQQLDDYFAGERKQFQLAITQPGTAFQQNVWNSLLHIPFGKTISYLELSKRIGNVKAIRAVGMCNGRNRICIIVPCHRVIGSNGKLVGYGGDLWRKKWLLDHEAKFESGIQELFSVSDLQFPVSNL